MMLGFQASVAGLLVMSFMDIKSIRRGISFQGYDEKGKRRNLIFSCKNLSLQ